MLKINGIEFNSADYLLVDVGDIQTAKKRVVETVDIYGANGSYVVHDEGYENSERELTFSVKEFEKISKQLIYVIVHGNFSYAPESNVSM